MAMLVFQKDEVLRKLRDIRTMNAAVIAERNAELRRNIHTWVYESQRLSGALILGSIDFEETYRMGRIAWIEGNSPFPPQPHDDKAYTRHVNLIYIDAEINRIEMAVADKKGQIRLSDTDATFRWMQKDFRGA